MKPRYLNPDFDPNELTDDEKTEIRESLNAAAASIGAWRSDVYADLMSLNERIGEVVLPFMSQFMPRD